MRDISTRDKSGEDSSLAKSRLFRKLSDFATKAAKFVVKLAVENDAAIAIDYFDVKKSVQRDLPSARKLLYVGKFREKLKYLCKWHGLPYLEVRLPSRRCPRCGKRLEFVVREARCECGYSDDRDDVPIIWAKRILEQKTFFVPSTIETFGR